MNHKKVLLLLIGMLSFSIFIVPTNLISSKNIYLITKLIS